LCETSKIIVAHILVLMCSCWSYMHTFLATYQRWFYTSEPNKERGRCEWS